MIHEFRAFSGENIIHTLKHKKMDVWVTGFCKADMEPGDIVEIHQWFAGSKKPIVLTIITVEKKDHKGKFKNPDHGKNAHFTIYGKLSEDFPILKPTQSQVPPSKKRKGFTW